MGGHLALHSDFKDEVPQDTEKIENCIGTHRVSSHTSARTHNSTSIRTHTSVSKHTGTRTHIPVSIYTHQHQDTHQHRDTHQGQYTHQHQDTHQFQGTTCPLWLSAQLLHFPVAPSHKAARKFFLSEEFFITLSPCLPSPP